MSTMFTSKPNLTQRATVAVVGALWNQKTISALLNDLWTFRRWRKADWLAVEGKVLSNVELLLLPVTVKENITNFIQPMGAQIKKWMEYNMFVSEQFPEVFYWTEKGTLDFLKTAKNLLKDKDFTVMNRYRLACTYCIEEEILALWPVVEERFPKGMYEMPIAESELVCYWTFLLKDGVQMFMDVIEYCGVRSPPEFGFHVATGCEFDCALEYFMQRLDPSRKSKVILAAARKLLNCTNQKPSMLLLLVSAMCKEMRDEFFGRYSRGVLSSLVTWPYQDFLVEVAEQMWDTLSEAYYLTVLEDLARCVSEFHKSDIYFNVFRDFWRKSPARFKKYVISKCVQGTFLSRLFILGKTDRIIKLIFREANVDEKRQMIFYFEGMNICDTLIVKGRWESLEMFVQECILSKNTMERFKEEYPEHVRFYPNIKLTSNDVCRFLNLLNSLTKKLVI